jgi:hypothetical protein
VTSRDAPMANPSHIRARPSPRVTPLMVVLLASTLNLTATAQQPSRPLDITGAPTAQTTDPSQRILLDRSLNRRVVREVEFGAESISFRDSAGRAGSLPRASIVAILPADPGESVGSTADEPIVWRELTDINIAQRGRLELADGQIFPGSLTTKTPQTEGQRPKPSENIGWAHPLLGPLSLPLERVALAVLNNTGLEQLADAPITAGDLVGLTNRDRVEGFVLSLDQNVTLENNRKPVTFPISRVSYVRVANPPSTPSGSRLWLHDGTIIDVTSIQTDRAGSTRIESPLLPQGRASVLTPDIASAALNVQSLQSLSRQSIRNVNLSPDREMAPRPSVRVVATSPLGAHDIDVTGPISVTWSLPAGATRVAGLAELPRNCRQWGDFTVVINAGAEPRRERINSKRPAIEFNVPVGSAGEPTLTLTIEADDTGPIQDRVILKRTLILVEPTAANR